MFVGVSEGLQGEGNELQGEGLQGNELQGEGNEFQGEAMSSKAMSSGQTTELVDNGDENGADEEKTMEKSSGGVVVMSTPNGPRPRRTYFLDRARR